MGFEASPPEWRALLPLQELQEGFHHASGTLFSRHKRPLKGYLAAIAVFCNEVKGKSALGSEPRPRPVLKSALALLHKLREAMAEK